MKLIEQNVEIFEQKDFSKNTIMKCVEMAGRICKNTEDKLGDTYSEDFINMLRKNGHYSPFGFGTVHIKIPKRANLDFLREERAFICRGHVKKPILNCKLTDFWVHNNQWFSINLNDDIIYITTSVRVMEEWDLWELLDPYITEEDSVYFERRPIVICNTEIAISRELNRHASVLSICERSTRFVKATEAIMPYGFAQWSNPKIELYNKALSESFRYYESMISLQETTKQEARGLLPLSAVTKVAYCGFLKDWKKVLDQRTSKGCHPQMIDLGMKIYNKLFYEG